MKTKLLLMLLMAVALSTLTGAAEIIIVNPGFEDPVLNDGKFTRDITGWQEGWYDLTSQNPTIWTGYSWAAGAVNPDADYGYEGIAPEGENIGYTTSDIGYDCGLRQILSATLQAGWTYELSALVGNPYVYNEGATADYRIELVAGGVVIASTNDNGLGQGDPSPVDDTYWTTAGLTFIPELGHEQLGEPLEIRILAVDLAGYYEVNFDDIRLNAYSDPMNPSPYDGESVTPPYPPDSGATGDEVILSWTNMDPNTPGDDVYVDVWFGTDPNRPNKPGCWTHVIDATDPEGENTTSATVSAPIIEPEPTTYFWQVNSHIYGADKIDEPNMIEGRIYRFYATTDLPIEFVDAGADMITWSGEAVQLDATVVDDGASALTYAWSAEPDIGVSFSATDIEDPIVTITKPGIVPIANASFEEPELNDGDYSWQHPGWGWFANDDYCGTWNPGSLFGGVMPEGEQMGFANGLTAGEGGFAQILAETLAPDTTYTLIVEVGNNGYYEWTGYKVQLLAGGTGIAPGEITGGTLLAEDDNTRAIASNTFETSTIVFTCSADDPNVGDPIQIRLIAKEDNEEVCFDDVRLYSFPAQGISPDVYTVELTLAVNDELNTTLVEDTMTIDVYEDGCQAARIGLSMAAENLGDIAGDSEPEPDCVTDIYDLAVMALTWLEDQTPIEPFVKP